MTNDEQCGYETPNGPCKNPATDGDSCWIDSHGGSKGGHGRAFVIDDSDHEDILQAAREGVSRSGCARAAGATKDSLRRYLESHPDFRAEFARARQRGEAALIADGLRDPETDSSMAKFLLSTSFDYVKTEKREVDHSGEIQTGLSTDEKRLLAEAFGDSDSTGEDTKSDDP